MIKRLLSLLLMLTLLLSAASGLGEQMPSLSSARISALQKLAGENGAQWREGMLPSPDMNAFQMWQWTDWFLSNRVRSLLGTLQDYQQLEPGTPLNAQAENDQWQLRETENILSRFEAQLEEDRLAILNGIRLFQSSGTGNAERLAAYNRIQQAENEIGQIITTICRDYQTYLSAVNSCSNGLQTKYGGYTLDVQAHASDSLAKDAANLEKSENSVRADFSVSVISTHQFCIRVFDANKNPLNSATVTVTNPLNQTQKQATTNAQGKAVFWVGDLGADEKSELLLSLRVEADGYRTREVQTIRLRSGETRSVDLQKDDGTPYLIMGCFNGKDILTESNTYYCTKQNTVHQAFTVKLHSDKDGELQLCYPVDANATEYKTVVKAFTAADSDKTVLQFEDQWLGKLPPGAKVSFILNAGGEQVTTDTLLVIQKAMVEQPIASQNALFSFFSGSNGVGFNIPDDVPFIGGSRLSIDMADNLPRAVYLPSYRAMYALGYDFKPEQANWQTRDAEDEEHAIKEFELKGKADEAMALAGAYRDINTTTQNSLLGEQSAYVTPFASLQGLYRANSNALELSGTAGAATAFHSDISQTFSVGPTSFFAGVTMDMDNAFGLDVTSATQLDMTGGVPAVVGNPKIDYGNESTVPLRMNMRTTSGTGVRDDMIIDVRGYGYLNPLVHFTTPRVTAGAKLDLGLEVTARTLLRKWNETIWNGELSLGELPQKPSMTPSVTGTEGLKPDVTEKLFSPIFIAADHPQYVQIGTDNYLFWIQPGADSNHASRLQFYNLSKSNCYGQINVLNGSSSSLWRESDWCNDYAFAVEAVGDYCALTILSGKFLSAGSGKEPATLSNACVATVLLQRDDGTIEPSETGMLDLIGYREGPFFDQGGDYPIMPEVRLLENNSVLSACSTANAPERIDSRLYTYTPNTDYYTGRNLEESWNLTCMDEAEITRYRLADVSASVPQTAFYTLSRTSLTEHAQGALSRLTVRGGSACTREVLAQGNIISFQVLESSNPSTDRLFYLERVELEKGKYTQRLKCVTTDRTNSAATPVITDYDVEICADSFDIVKFGSGVFLYWTECSAPTAAAGQEIKSEYLVRCVRYDPDTDTVYGPFSLLELSERPSSVRLMEDGTGCYLVDLQTNQDFPVQQSFTRFSWKLVSTAELTAAAPVNPCVSAGDYADIVFSVRNTGNVPLSGFNVKISDGSKVLQTLHIDCINPENNSSTIGTKVMKGAHTVSRISSIYDPLNHDSWNITQTQTSRSATLRSVQTDMLMPGDTHSYTARLLVPADWAGGKTLTAAIDSVVGKPALRGVEENGVLMLTGVNDAAIPMHTRPSTDVQVLNTDAHDLMLSAQLFQRSGESYVHITLRNRSGNTASAVTPVLTSSFRGETLFSHSFVNAMGDDFGYSMDIPLKTLTKGRNLQELELHVDDRNDASYEDFADSDNHVRLLLTVQLCIVKQPQSIPASEGKEAVFSVTAAGGEKPYRYQWQLMTEMGQWKDIPGADQDTYRIASVKNEQNGLTVRCVVTDQFGDSVTSDSATLFVLPLTGDRSQLTLWLLLALSSVAMLVVLGRKRYSR